MKQFVHTSHHKELVNTLPYIGVGVLLLAIVLLLEKVGLIATEPFYVGMHTSVELFSVVISFLIFAIGWNTWHFTRNSKLLLLSCLMLCVAIFDALHFLSFSSVSDHEKNMEQVFAFWLFARFFNAAAFLVIATAIWVNYKLFNARVVLSTLLSVTACIVAVVFYFPDWLPTLYIEGGGSSQQKWLIEITLITLYSLAACMFASQLRKPRNTLNIAGKTLVCWLY